jgi:hypothetical protein
MAPIERKYRPEHGSRLMGFFKNLTDATQLEEEIIHFQADGSGYYAYPRRGGRIDILHAFNFQPPIENFDDYYSFMFVESIQGFFLLRQRMLENRPQPWHICLELKPAEPQLFFNQALNLAESLRRRAEEVPPRTHDRNDCA